MLSAILNRYQGQRYFDISSTGIINVLSRLPRFVGWGSREITVLHHSLHVLSLCRLECPTNTRLQLLALVHDFPEAIYGDIPSYIKENFSEEDKNFLWCIDRELYEKLGIDYPTHSESEIIKKYDLQALTIEAEYVFAEEFDPKDWPRSSIIDPKYLYDILWWDDSRDTANHEFKTLMENQ